MKKTNRSFFGLMSSYNDVLNEIRIMADGISSNGVECQIYTPSRFVGFGTISTNGVDQKHYKKVTSKGDIAALVDGEIYNLPELVKELKAKGHSANNNQCDVVISAYEAWGIESFNKLNGIYAIALCDARKNKLFLIRDPHGAKALYFHFNKKSGLTFASRLSILFKRSAISPDIELSSIQEYLRFLDISTPNTIYKNVFSLEPGCTLECNKRGYTLKPLEFKSQSSPSLSFDESLDRVDYLLTKSIERRFDSGKTGFFLSGGIDSSLLCALGAKIAKDKIVAFTVGFNDKKLNEMPVAKEIAGFLGINQHELYFNIDQYHDAFDTIVSSINSPFADPATVPTLLCFNYCRKYVDVAIDGTGADGLLGSMPPRYIRFALGYSSRLPINMRHKIASFLKNRSMLNGYAPIFDFEEPQELLIRWKGWSKREIEELCRCKCSFEHTTFYKVFCEGLKLSPLELYSVLLSNMPDDRLHEMSFLSNLTVRFPYWDNEFVSFVKGLQVSYKYRHGQSKFILRKLLASYVPESLWNVPKHGFNFPFEVLLKWNNFEFIKKYLSIDSLKLHGFFDIQTVNSYVNRYINSDSSLRFKIWALVVFQAWYLRHHRV